jgi:AcrR family transcriptional regulator
MATENGPRRPDAPPPGRRKPTSAEAAERVASKIDAKISRTGAKLERVSAKVQGHQEMLDRLSGHLGALDVWTRIEPAGRRPRFTRDEIAAAAVRIADTEGFAAVSMRHLASELGAGTMTLYHYVRTKDELLTLVTDSVMGEVVMPPDEQLPHHWRDAVTVIARRTRQAMLRHPWILDITDDPPIGPNSVRHFDQSLQAVSSLDLRLGEKLDIVSTIDEYVFGHCLHERNNVQGQNVASDEMTSYVNSLVATGDYPQLAALADEHGLDGTWALVEDHFRDQGRFERNLRRILDGIEASITRGAP